MDEQIMMQMIQSQQAQITLLTQMLANMQGGAPMQQSQPMPPPIVQSPPPLQQSRRMKFSALVDLFLESKKGTLQPTSLSNYNWTLRRSEIGARLQDKYVDELTHGFLQGEIDKAAPSRNARDTINTIKTMLKFARLREVCEVPPLDPLTYDYKKVTRTRPNVEIDTEKTDALLNLCEEDFDKHMAARAIYIALSCGLRIGEVCGLKWTDWDAERRVLRIERAVKIADGKTEYISDPKTEAGKRAIPICEGLAAFFDYHKGEDAFVVHRIKESKNDFYSPHDLRVIVKTYMRLNGFERYTFHSFRHTFVSQKIRSGVSAKSVSAYVGHTDIKMTLGTYTHINADDLKQCVKSEMVTAG